MPFFFGDVLNDEARVRPVQLELGKSPAVPAWASRQPFQPWHLLRMLGSWGHPVISVDPSQRSVAPVGIPIEGGPVGIH